jgi:serine phosphatase RsbU (regulator of sigma subunit)
MKRIFIFFIVIFVHISTYAQINKYGTPFVTNYAPNEYNGAEQNWSICEDTRGVVYFGNNDKGVLEFDGKNWRKIPISNNSIIRSLACSEDGTVYVGGVAEFGYLAPDINGQMKYISLVDQLDSVVYSDVWKIFVSGKETYFCSKTHIFKYHNKKLIKDYNYSNDVEFSFLSFMIDNKIYWGSYDGGIYELNEDSIEASNGGDFYKDKDIFVMLSWSDTEIFISTIQGTYIYNKETGFSKNMSSLGKNYEELIKELSISQVYNGIQLQNGNYALATLNNGCLIFEKSGKLIHKLNKDNGLQDVTVINLFEDSRRNLWLSLNKGISYAELNSPFTTFGQEHYNIDGIISNIIEFNGEVYVSTNTSLYYLEFDETGLPKFKKIDFDPSVSSFFKYKVPNSDEEKLILATDRGIWELKNKNAELEKIDSRQSDALYYAGIVYQSKGNPNRLFIGDIDKFAALEYKNGNWKDLGEFKGFKYKIETITEDENGSLWLGTALNGVIKFNADSSFVQYGIDDGLPVIQGIRTYFINGNVVCATSKGLYFYDEEANVFKKYKGFGEKYFSRDEKVKRIDVASENEFWIISVDSKTNLDYIEKLTISQDRIITIENTPFKRLINNSVHNIYTDRDSVIWIAATNAVYVYKESENIEYKEFYNSLVRKVEIGIDSVLFNGAYFTDTLSKKVSVNQPKELKIAVPYKDRSFKFFYSTPYFPNTGVTYSSKLLGYDDNWSAWSEETDRPYTNLNEGKYTFLVKAKNIYGIESEIAKYEFTIKPPWYKTIIAFIFYVIIAVFVIVIIVKVYTRRLEQEKIRLEQIVKERTEEVVKQKEEIEGQRDEISAKNKSITDSIEYAKRIQTAILPSEEFAKEFLPEHFILFRPRDIVSGDFYWMTKKDNLLVLIAADCTGHGVPGAFMSMLGVSFLNEIINRHNVTKASEILNSLRTDIKKTLGQEGKEGEAKDGMDIALCIIDLENMKMQYSGAYNPLYLFRNNEFIEVKADRMPIGIYIKEKDSFTNNEIDLQKGDVFYIFSDGFQDQFGGEDGQKFKTKNYKKLLLDIHQKPMAEQREILDTTVDAWRGDWEQVDDIIIMGIRV